MMSRLGNLFAALITGLFILSSAAAFGATNPGQPATLRLQAEGEVCRASLVEAGPGGMTLQLDVPSLTLGKTTLDGRDFDTLDLPGGQSAGVTGQPALPVFSQLVAVPRGMKLALTGVQETTATLAGPFLPAPSQDLRARGDQALVFDAAYYAGLKSSLPGEQAAVQVGEPGLIRGQRVVPVTFRPVSWDPATGSLVAASRLTATLELVSSDDRNEPRFPGRPVPESFVSLYRESVLGYDKAADGESVLGTWLVVYPNVSGVSTALAPLLDWRQRQGYNVVAVSTATTGTGSSAIKSYLQNLYDTLEIPLEFVTLVGDADGAVALASWRESLSGYSGEGDHEYTRLEGGDVLADVHLGRLSVTSLAELTTVVNKIVNYESAPHVSDDLGWFTRAGLTGDPSSSGYSTIWVSQWLKEQLQGLSYTQIDTIWDGNFVSRMMTTINQGESIFTYRGYWGMSGMNTGYIASLANGAKLPFALILTCDTGSFWTDTVCRSEAFLRAPGGGGVASIGTATIGTHTRYNNCMFQGVAEGVLNSGDPRVGPGLTRGKLSMYENYIAAEPEKVTIWSTWNNLMGDPATAIWTGVPAALTVDYPAALAAGANALPVTVTSGGVPVAGARVAVYQKDTVQVNGLTDDLGRIILPIGGANTGGLLLTVTGRNLRPHLGGFNVGPVDVAVGYTGQDLVDDGTGASSGNGDGLAAPAETVEIAVELTGLGTGGAASVTAQLLADGLPLDIMQGAASYGYLASGAAGFGDQPFVVALDPAAVGGRTLDLTLEISSGGDTWTSLVPLTVHGPAASVGDLTLSGVGDGLLDPGETGTLRVGLGNPGNLATAGATAVLSINSQWVSVVDEVGTYPAIPAGGSASNSLDQFTISAAADCYPGYLASFVLDLTFAEGGTARLEFQLPVGAAATTDPVGPDRHGYHAFDNTDTGYPEAPTYQWVEIDPGQGGAGTSVGLTDFGNYQDDTRTVGLPFSFGYYGHSFDEISVCSNGWVAMGQTYVRSYRNWTIPSPGAPDNLIAVCWDDHHLQSSTGGVFTWHDTANHRFVIEWSRMENTEGGTPCSFQVFLYDPAFQAGDSGDGLIVMQYQSVNLIDSTDGYVTVGIQNAARDDGLLYTYYNRYPAGAASLGSGRAVAFRTIEAQVLGTLSGAVSNASAGNNPVDGAAISVLGAGRSFLSSVAGSYQGSVPVGLYDVAVSHPGFAADTTFGVAILEGAETVVDFQLQDTAGPAIFVTDAPANTPDTAGPYLVAVDLSDYSGIQSAAFHYTSSASGGPFTLPLVPAGGDAFTAAIPGQPDGTRVQYWLTASDVLGQQTSEPAGAPFAVHSFVITDVSAIAAADMETDDGWTSGMAGDTATTGQWIRVDPNGVYDLETEIQPENDHTAAGTMCWITGDDPAGSSQGVADVDGGLTTLLSPSFDVAGVSALQVSYHRWYTNDTGQNPGSDVWRVQALDAAGVWVTLEETMTSNRSWLPVSFQLADHLTLGDQVAFRFLAEDAGYGSVIEAGVDDFQLLGYNLPGDQAAPVAALTSFNGGQTVAPGSQVPITWTHGDDMGVVQVDLLLSTDGGGAWDHVVASGPWNQSYQWTVPALVSGSCRLKIVAHDAAGNTAEAVSAADFAINGTTPAGDLPVNRVSLGQNAPNPFNPRTEIRFALPSRQPVTLRVYNVEGKLVRTLIQGPREAGAHTVVWEGDDDRGGRVASGLYFYRLGTDHGVLTRKMTLLK